MLHDEFIHATGAFLDSQAGGLLSKQASVAASTYDNRSGALARSLSASPVSATAGEGGISVTLSYPKHIRFLDMKKDRSGHRKKRYAPIYNKYVYGFLKSGVWRWLNSHVPGMIVRSIHETFTDVR